MKRLSNILLVLTIGFMAFGSSACYTKAEPGYVGIVVNTAGTQKNATDFPIQRGRIWYNPFTADVYTFPTFLQNITWTKSKDEGRSADESITFNSVEGAPVNADIALAYTFQADKVPEIFVRFRQDAKTITEGYMRNKVRAAFSAVASTQKVQDIYGAGKQQFLAAVKQRLNSELGPEGFQFDMVDFIGQPRLPDNVQSAINASLQATQDAQTAENQLRKTQAEAAKAVAEAKGVADAEVIRAEGDARANEARMRTLTPLLLQSEAIKKWNGVLPQVQGGQGGQMIQLLLAGHAGK